MKWFISIPLAMVLIAPSCQNHFKAGTIEIINRHGDRTLQSTFHDGQIGKIGRGYLFRAQLPDGGSIMIESRQPTEPEEQKK